MTVNSLIVGQIGEGGWLGSAYIPLAGGQPIGNPENTVNLKLQQSAVFSHAGFNWTIQAGASASATFRQAGLNGNQVVSFPASFSGFLSDTTHTDVGTAGVAYDWNIATVTLSMTPFGNNMTCNASSQFTWYGLGVFDAGSPIPIPATANYANYQGGTEGGTAAPNDSSQGRVESAGTFRNLGTMIATAPTVSSTFQSNINGAAGNEIVTFSSGIGWMQDTTHTDAITAGQDLCTSYVNSNGSGKWWFNAYEFNGATNLHDWGTSMVPNTVQPNLTFWWGGIYFWGAASESNNANQQSFGVTQQFLRARTIATSGATMTVSTRVGGVTGNESVSFAAATGLKVDSTHTDAVPAATGNNMITTAGTNVFSQVFISGMQGAAGGGEYAQAAVY